MRFLLYYAVCLLLACTKPAPDTPPPNIVLILADDLGYGELGCYGQSLIETPNIDRLAREGMRFTQHYSGAAVCAPARCVLLTGMHTGHAYIRGNDEWAERGEVWNYEAVYRDPGLEGQRPIPDSLVLVSELLREVGYTTACIGKWGLGAPATEGAPERQGFDYFYGYNCQRQAHTLYPGHLYENVQRVYLDNALIAPHANLPTDADTTDKAAYDAFQLNDYAPELMGEKALAFIEQQRDSAFFLLFASPLPHLPLQAPERWVEYYREKFGPEPPYTNGSYFPCYAPRATYAAMISYLDEQVGLILDKLAELGLDENTIVLFTSDNGPTYTGGADTEFFDSARPFRTTYGFGKGFLHEGGIRVPLLARWPGKIAAGSISRHISSFQDYLPTLCELARRPQPAGRDGINFVPELLSQPQDTHRYLYWEQPEYGGQQAVRAGQWKGLIKGMRDGNRHMALFDLAADPRETQDVSADFPDVATTLEGYMKEAHLPSPIPRFRLPIDDD
ncbi:MAG: arylsulfatase [Saprospiraceae bacterium]|nr:arylsulfatase [Saprospiraceae bacterium]